MIGDWQVGGLRGLGRAPTQLGGGVGRVAARGLHARGRECSAGGFGRSQVEIGLGVRKRIEDNFRAQLLVSGEGLGGPLESELGA